LSRSLDQVSDFACLGYFFIVDIDFIINIAIFAAPYLLVSFSLELTNLTKYSLTCFADFSVTCCDLTLVFEAVKLDLKDVRVELLPVLHGCCHGLG
jgi:hypothetical protein